MATSKLANPEYGPTTFREAQIAVKLLANYTLTLQRFVAGTNRELQVIIFKTGKRPYLVSLAK